MIILEHIPQHQNELNEEWDRRAERHETWWIKCFKADRMHKGWNINQTLVRVGKGRSMNHPNELTMREAVKSKRRKRHTSMMWARRKQTLTRARVAEIADEQAEGRLNEKQLKRKRQRIRHRATRAADNTLSNLFISYRAGTLDQCFNGHKGLKESDWCGQFRWQNKKLPLPQLQTQINFYGNYCCRRYKSRKCKIQLRAQDL